MASYRPGTGGKKLPLLLVLVVASLFVGFIAATAVGESAKTELQQQLEASSSTIESLKRDLRTVRDSRDELLEREEEVDGILAEAESMVADVEEREAAIKEEQSALKVREAAVSKEEEKAEANTIHQGTCTVGVDIKPGTYRTIEPVESSCYWGIYRTGSNQDDIIANDIPGGGRPSVTLSKGQDFTTVRCGSWKKQ